MGFIFAIFFLCSQTWTHIHWIMEEKYELEECEGEDTRVSFYLLNHCFRKEFGEVDLYCKYSYNKDNERVFLDCCLTETVCKHDFKSTEECSRVKYEIGKCKSDNSVKVSVLPDGDKPRPYLRKIDYLQYKVYLEFYNRTGCANDPIAYQIHKYDSDYCYGKNYKYCENVVIDDGEKETELQESFFLKCLSDFRKEPVFVRGKHWWTQFRGELLVMIIMVVVILIEALICAGICFLVSRYIYRKKFNKLVEERNFDELHKKSVHEERRDDLTKIDL